MRKFKREGGYFIIMVDGKKLFMRSHPKTMLQSMEISRHDQFLVFKDTKEMSRASASIRDLKKYIRSIEENHELLDKHT